jgi:1-acyl-sn-glycerol-3-phosphate acyltransferase
VLRPLFRLVRWFAARLVTVFYREVQHSGRDDLPQDCPLLFAANHPYSVMDPIVLMTSVKRPVHFLARAGLFRLAPVAWLLRTFHAIPVQRRQDGGNMGGNTTTFDATHEVLAQGGVVGIFPHGQNVEERRVEQIRSGAARIVLGAEAAHGWSLGIHVVPVGMNYEDRDRFNSRLLVRWGAPLEVAAYRARYEADSAEAVRELTNDLLEGMRHAAVHLEEDVARRAVDLVRTMYEHHVHKELIGDAKTLEDRFFIERRIGDAIAWFGRVQPEALETLMLRIERHLHLMRRVHLRERVFRGGKGSPEQRRRVVGSTLRMMAGFPAALWGLVHNVVPYMGTVWFTRFAAEEAIVAVTMFLSGIALFGIWYAALAAVLFQATGSMVWTVVYGLSVPGSGLFAVGYVRWLRRTRHEVMAGLIVRRHPMLLAKLKLDREELIEELDALRVTFVAETGSELSDHLDQRSSPP